MPKEKEKPSIDTLRHSEYYGMQEIFDDLYARSKAGNAFTDLMDIILSRENILLAYRNIKTNAGSMTPGTDKLTIANIGCLSPDEVVSKAWKIVYGHKRWGYRPKPVRRKDIPKPNGKTRPLGIPCIWDRLVQQCIKQVLEPICEAKFSENSYGFRPNRSVENAIASIYKLMQRSNLHYVVEFDIKSFFDEVDHSKLIRQLWALGIRDTSLLAKIRCILKAPIRMPAGKMVYPTKGTPQGGIISPLLANVVLNELDHWVESQWLENPAGNNYKTQYNKKGIQVKSNGYRAMRDTNLKEMYIVRYADDFRILCRTKTQAENTRIAVTKWLHERLRLEVSPEKTRVVNVKRRYSEFLGFKIKVHPKAGKYVVKSHVSDKQLKKSQKELTEQVKQIARPEDTSDEYSQIRLYNSKVLGKQLYYQIATEVNIDFRRLSRSVMTVLTNRLGNTKKGRLRKSGRALTTFERQRYGKSAMLRYVTGTDEPIYPIGYIQHKKPIHKKRSVNCYTKAGRQEIHSNLQMNVSLMLAMMKQPLYGRSIEYADNRISLFSAQQGKCAATGIEFQSLADVHCHHKILKSLGGNDKYENLVLVLEPVHKLIHAKDKATVQKYLKILNLNAEQLTKVNALRKLAQCDEITA